MYLISVYFDERTENRILGYMKQIAKYTGNTEMLDGNVPPHITIAAFCTDSERKARELFQKASEKIDRGNVQWVSVGSFLPGAIYITPVLNEYLHRLSEIYNEEIKKQEEVEGNLRYQPFGWLPHTTLAKHLTKEQMKNAFETMQNQFGAFEGNVVKIGLAKTNPYTDLDIIALK
jgi:2'-5' RNA ligase